MPANNIHIGELNIRVPGMSRREAQSLGAQVAKHLSENAPNIRRRENIGAMNVQIQNTKGLSRDTIVRLIAEKIAGGLE